MKTSKSFLIFYSFSYWVVAEAPKLEINIIEVAPFMTWTVYLYFSVWNQNTSDMYLYHTGYTQDI